MDDRLRETLSAMMDDEADELAVRRLLSHANQSEVQQQWHRWQQIRDLMHDHHISAQGVDVAQAVRATLDGQARHERARQPVENSSRRVWQWPVAAMVAVALLVGFGAGAGWDGDPASPLPTPVVAKADPAGNPANLVVEEVALQGLDDEQMKQMRQYLLEHAQHNSVGAGRGSVGYARLVSATGNY
ncbi:MAG: anti-sigma factor [Marinobacter sp. 34-60-7]|nr:MAG: anti-sigma factor [Marinobacter sp. 34-60-7]